MNIESVMQPQNQLSDTAAQAVSADMVAIAKKQRFQDAVFHRVTQAFSLLVLAALLGIILSLFVNAWPTFQKFGFQFLWHVEWDIIKEDFGAAIAIVGTVTSAGIALLIAVSAVGTTLIKREGIKVYREFVAAIQRGEEPAEQLVHGVCLLAAGVLMLAPGFMSDVVAILLLVPPTRVLIAKLVLRKSTTKVTVIRATHTGPIVEVTGEIGGSNNIIDVEPHEGESKQ